MKRYRAPDDDGGSRWRGTFALDGGGALINQAIHTLDVLLHLWGPIASVDARAGTQLHAIEVEDTVVATLQFENGALGTFEASTAVYPGYARRVELTGANGTLTIEHDQLVGVDLKEPDARFTAMLRQLETRPQRPMPPHRRFRTLLLIDASSRISSRRFEPLARPPATDAKAGAASP